MAMAPEPIADKKGLAIILCNAMFGLIAVICVILRVYATYLRGAKFRLHDYLIFGGLAMTIALAVVDYFSVFTYSAGMHVTEVTPEDIEGSIKILLAGSALWITATALIKLSVLALYYEVFNPKVAMRIAVWISAAIVGAFWIGLFVTVMVNCQPIAYYWDKTIPDGHCGSVTTAIIAGAAFNMPLDLIVVVLPVPILVKLELPMWKRVTMIVIMGLGMIICGINVARIIVTVRSNDMDITYWLADIAIYSALEVWIGLSLACLPTLGPIVRPVRDRSSPSAQSYRTTISRNGAGTHCNDRLYARPSSENDRSVRGKGYALSSVRTLNSNFADFDSEVMPYEVWEAGKYHAV